MVLPESGQGKPESYAIMMCGHTSIEERWGDYAQMAETILRNPQRNEKWQSFNVCDGIFPSEEQVRSFKGIVITGSKHDAFADDPWIVKLRQLMREEAQRGQRILGICFGCQLMAIALGGQAGRAACGWEAGSKPMIFLPAFMEQPFSADLPVGWQVNVHETHQDQVLELPPGAVLLASSMNTLNEMWIHGGNVLGIQGHPEFTPAFQRALNQYRVDLGTMTEAQKLEAEQEMQDFPVTPESAAVLNGVLKRFLKQ